MVGNDRRRRTAVLRLLLCSATLALLSALLMPAWDHPPQQEPPVSGVDLRDYTEVIPGTKVSFDLVAVPGGTFLRGSPEGEKGRAADEGPRHQVKVNAFWMGKCEVTWDEFDLYSRLNHEANKKHPQPADKAADAVTRPTPPYIDETWGFGREGHPVVAVSHHAAMEYCRWLSLKTGKVYRLPTEAEWEYACRAGTTTAYFFGDSPERLGWYAWYDKNAEESTHPVGKKRPNPWGLHDIFGNVAEWCLDHYAKDAYRSFPPGRLAVTPVKVPTASRFPHVVRGGSWADPAEGCRSAVRRGSDKRWNRLDPGEPRSVWWLSDADYVGFRVVRPVLEQDELKGLRSKVTPNSM
jgi:formylglycine-generating enzyme required for sulfatase activity